MNLTEKQVQSIRKLHRYLDNSADIIGEAQAPNAEMESMQWLEEIFGTAFFYRKPSTREGLIASEERDESNIPF